VNLTTPDLKGLPIQQEMVLPNGERMLRRNTIVGRTKGAIRQAAQEGGDEK
jgi:hypothetical protein